MPGSLDVSLDDMIESSGNSRSSWGRGGKGSWGGGDAPKGEKKTYSKTEKLDMSLDEVIENSGWDVPSGRGGKKGGGKGYNGRSGSSWWGSSFDRDGGYGRRSERGRSRSWGRRDRGSGRPSDRYDRYGGKGGQRRSQGHDNGSFANVRRIKVTNVPRDLSARDIKEAFEAEAGKTTQCELDRGVAFVTFTCTEDARKAVQTFDRGELNGKTIQVTLEP